MASITYKSLSSLQPIELKYRYYKDEEIKNTKISFKEGYTFYQNEALLGYQDTTINRESSFVLTSAIPLNNFFTSPETYSLGKLPGSIYLQPRNTIIYYAAYKSSTNSITLSTTGSPLYIMPVPGTNEVEILVDNKYLRVEKDYPFNITTSLRTLPTNSIQRQRFECIYQNSFITFKTQTVDGPRYLTFNNDNTLRATGVMFNNSLVNDYVFKAVPVSTNTTTLNFDPINSWLTYYFTFTQEQENKTVTVNKEFLTPTNLLIDFPVEEAVKTGKANINVANLKTQVTPFDGPAPINNLP